METSLTDPIFHDEDAARKHFEALRWPNGRSCPHCGVIGESALMQGRTHRPGLYKCRACRKPFSATMGTVYERSHIPMHKWLLATHLMVSSKKGISAHQLYRMLGFGSYRTAWFMAHRIREAMTSIDTTPFGSGGGIVEVDETFLGRERAPIATAKVTKMKVLSLIDRQTKRSRSIVIDSLTVRDMLPFIAANVAPEATLMTDQAMHYRPIGKEFAAHVRVDHGKGEYVNRENPMIHTNTIESWFGVFKRGMKGIYQHCGRQHLNRYLIEFDFRYAYRSGNGFNDSKRAAKAIAGATGKRLTYQQIAR